MFQLYQKRNFSEFISDTFAFLKEEGKNYFKNYFIINGPLLLILSVCVYLLTKVYMEAVFSSMINDNINSNGLLNDLMNNIPLFITLGLLSFLLIIIISMINYSFPISYLKLVGTKSEITTQTIFDLMKEKIGKTIVFFFASLVIFMPILVIACILLVLLCFIIIGFPLFFIVIPAFFSWVKLSYYDYISSEYSYMKSVGNGFDLLRSKFWPIVGSTIVMYIIYYIISSAITMIPYLFGILSFFTDLDSKPNQAETLSMMSILVTMVMVISIISSYTLQNLIFINQGIIFYSVTDEKENISIKSDIDLIGSESE
ncbi:conserved membrane hypothetical protein [Flavobacterium sp. 9AF]|uniref:hypothetical protein n=1 Tax=Flavobacterium sp. 9AF TaxID=2653142 RepID=UPI0012F4661A|nr:hypothetical protein [Flavobacterium sp. 9AF]VXB67880.1 conserved membrane hypothetical protein [Flavobacterium sp. 9AF]